VRQLLRSHQDEISRRRQRSAGQAESSAAASDGEGEAMFRRVKRVRGELNRAVSVWAQMSGESHASVHSRLRRVSGGPAVAQADLHQLEQRLKTVRGWMRRGRR
jgi:hypothetical protein